VDSISERVEMYLKKGAI